MGTISDFLGRKGVTTAPLSVTPSSQQQTTNTAANEPTFADLGACLGEGNEALRNLLIDTERRITALDDVKDAFRNLVEPIGTALQALEHENSDNVSLRNALAELRASHDTLRTEFQALEKRSAELESDNQSLKRELALVQQVANGLESDKAELTSEVVAARAEIANLENRIGARDRRCPCAGRGERAPSRPRQWR